MTPTKYELLIKDGYIILRFYAEGLQQGFCNIERVPFNTGRSLPKLRAQGLKQAQKFDCPFVDLTR